MTTATREERFRHGRHLANIGVYLFLLATAAMPWFPRPPRLVSLLVMVVLGGIVLAVMKHERELCERCINRVPLDPGKAVAKNRLVLRMCHRAKWALGTMIALLLVSYCLPESWWESSLASTLSMTAAITMVFSANRHNVLQPWCPFCHRGDGGSESAEVPDPSDGKRKPVPA
jgi:hypothetical protein